MLPDLGKFMEKYLTEKIDDLGEEVLSNLLSGPLAIGFRVLKAVETGGGSEFDQMRQAWLNTLKPSMPGITVFNKFDSAFQKAKFESTRPQGWWKWSRTRREWLAQDWRHDWRSQPRDEHGRWVKGRLNYIYVSVKLRKKKRQARKIARKAVRSMFNGN